MQPMALLMGALVLVLALGACGGNEGVQELAVEDWVEGFGPKGHVTLTSRMMWGPGLEAGPGHELPPADAYVCGTVLDSNPPKCGSPVIPLQGLTDLDELPTEYDESGVVESVQVELSGTSDGTSIDVESVTVLD